MSDARALRRVVTAVLATVLLAGCGLFGRDNPTVGGPSADRDTPTVTILHAGAEPRQTLSFSFEEGSSVDLDLTVDLHLTQRSAADAESAQVLEPPSTVQTVRFTVEHTDDTGSDVTFEVLDANIDRAGTALTDAQVLELTAAVQTAIGVRGRMRIAPQGHLESVSYDTPDAVATETAGVIDSLERGLSNVVPALPVEPLGRGARWRTAARTTVGGVTVRQTVTYEVTALADDHFIYRATITQDSVEQDVTEDDEATGTRLLAADLGGTVTGMTSLVSLASESETSLSGSQVLEHTIGDGDTRRVTQEIDVSVVIGPSSR